MLEHLLTTPYFYSLALTLLHFLWQGALVAIALKTALLVIDKSKSQLRYALSASAMLANLVLAITTFIIVFPDDAIMQTSGSSPLALTTLVNELTQENTLLNYQELLPSLVAHSLPYISLLWMVCVFSLAAKLLIEMRNVNKLPASGSIMPEQALLDRFSELAQQINLKKTPKLLISLKIDVPMAIGWLKPVVLIPASMVSGLNAAQLEMLMLHELAHIRRHDYLVNLIQTIIELLFFFHPGVSWIAKQMRNEREYCSDDIAVQHCGDPIAYAHTLADTASLCANRHHHTIPSMAMAASGGDLKQRVLRLVGHHCAPSNDVSKWFAGISIFFAVMFIMSNKLLTFPYAQKWTNEFPWNNPSNTPVQAKKSNKNKSSNSLSNSTALADDSIAQQLLANQQEEQPASKFVKEYTIFNDNKLAEVAVTEQPSQTNIQQTIKEPISKQESLVNEAAPRRQAHTKDYATDVLTTETSAKRLIETASNTSPVNVKLEPTAAHVVTADANQQADLTSESLTTKSVKQTNFSGADASLSHKKLLTPPVNKSIELTDNSPSRIELALSSEQDLARNSSFKNPYQAQIAELAAEPMTTPRNDIFEELAQLESLPTSRPTLSVEQVKKPIWYEAEQIKTAEPVYPSLAKRKGIEVEVKVNFTIDKQGNVKNISFVQQNRVNYFKNSIRAAIKKWRFLPAKVGDKPVESQMSKIFSFSLQG
ncbi:M56 family metallopeptidase [Litorilituus lipolyticus]|uniref:Protein TonB n=1 Tax=Litorilituus lipolyticus TaxID=2491017 RepID=A0A502L188_9GAMM|nr:M56 family metallopeptidase [Litorilituus lipolyticus]TPH17750.1 M56 family peptidase [Litorilituus lipolyticus]